MSATQDPCPCARAEYCFQFQPIPGEGDTVSDDDAYTPDSYHPDDIANGNAAEAQAEDARRKAEDDESEES